MPHRPARLLGIGVAAVVSAAWQVLGAHVAHAQETAREAERTGGLEEVVVTARKREESLQEVPIAVTAFSDAALESIGARGLEDIALRTPGVQFNEQAGQIPGRFNCSIRFRGMNVNTEQPVAQLGALFIDGIFIASGCNSIGAEDLARVEVVKGPQAVYFGRNTFGGAVNYVTKDPGNDWTAKLSASATEDKETEFSGSFQGPIVEDHLFFRLAARYYDRGDVFGRSADGGSLGEQKTRSVATKMVFKPTDFLTFKLRGQYSEDRDGPPGSGFLNGALPGNDTCTGTRGPNGEVRRGYFCGEIPGPGSARTQNPSGDIFSYNTSLSPASFPTLPEYLRTQLLQNGANDPAISAALGLDYYGLKRNMSFVGATADWEFPNDWTLSAVFGHNEMKSNWLRDFDLTEVEAWWSTDPQDLEDDTYEIRLTSGQDQALTWVIGLSAYEMNYTQSGNGGTVVTSFPPMAPSTLRTPATFNNSLVNNVEQKYESVFGGVTWKFAEDWSVSAEARYQRDEISKGQIIAAQLGRSPATAEWTDTLPRFILQWQPSPATNVYASYSKGALPGDINAEYIFGPDNMRTPEQVASAREQIRSGAAPYPEISPTLANGSLGVPGATDALDREELQSYEIGWKQQWLEGRFQTNLAAYFMKWANQKGRLTVTIIDFNGNTTQPYVRDPATCPLGPRVATDPTCNDTVRSLQFAVPGSSELRGLELESTFLFTDRLSAQFNVDYTDNEYTDFTFNFVQNVAGTSDMKGNSSPRYPEWKGNVALSYADAPLGSGDWRWFARGDLIYFGEYFVDESNLANAPDQTLLNARVGVQRDNLRIELFGNNLLDEDAYASASRWTNFTTPGVAGTTSQGVAVAPQRERYFGIKASLEF
jgi:iron complex outermembrane receptor protein